jgi:hypothetical protein
MVLSRPCDASDNRMLFNGHARAGDEVRLSSATGSVCVDHTYGKLRESQWAGPELALFGKGDPSALSSVTRCDVYNTGTRTSWVSLGEPFSSSPVAIAPDF